MTRASQMPDWMRLQPPMRSISIAVLQWPGRRCLQVFEVWAWRPGWRFVMTATTVDVSDGEKSDD
jgi:hypothetical protein